MSNYTDEELIDQLKNLSDELGGKTPTAHEFNMDAKTVSVKCILNRFGSWNKFVKKAGLNITRKRTNHYSKKAMIKQITKLYEELNRTPTPKEFYSSCKACKSNVMSVFKTWRNFVESAKLPVRNRGNLVSTNRRISKTELIEQFRVMKNDLDRIPSGAEFNRNKKTASISTIRRRFNTWKSFLEVAN